MIGDDVLGGGVLGLTGGLVIAVCGDIVIGDFDDMGTATGFNVDGAKVCGRIVGEAVVGLPVGVVVLTTCVRSFKSYERTDRVASLNVA